MNRLTSRQRKTAYLLGIVMMVFPIVALGMPASNEVATGGKLAELRDNYDLGETNLGDVDPTSAAMNLVLLGLRGVATNLLWLDAQEQQKTKNWGQFRADLESIVRLQPHFKEVWRHQGWNIAYNVSAEWDKVTDRYYWVKEGGKFVRRGTERNRNYSELYWETGRILGDKVGNSDEWKQFREFFRADPDVERFGGGTDTEFNVQERADNYLAAKDSFFKANETELEYGQRMMMRPLFRQWPARTQLNYAGALQREGNFGEIQRLAWQDAYREWTEDFGQEVINTNDGALKLEATPAELAQAAEQAGSTVEQLATHQNQMLNQTNYRYWKVRAESESEPETAAAHREIYEGQQMFKEQRFDEAQQKLFTGMEKFAQLLQRHPELSAEDNTVEEGLMAALYYRYILQLRGQPTDGDFPLKFLWDANQDEIGYVTEDFRRDNGL